MLIYLVVCLIFTVLYLYIIGFYLKGWLKSSHQITEEHFDYTVSASILIPVRNEEKHIAACLKSLLAQNFPSNKYEILLIDDFSEDNTFDIAQSVVGENGTCLQLSDYIDEAKYKHTPNKKRAISLGVSKAKHPIIITVDSDCFYGKNWLASLMQYYHKKRYKLITGPVRYYRKKGIWHQFLQLDFSAIMGITCGSMNQQFPILANGANMLFEKQVFEDLMGYEGNDHIASGDDIFLLQKIYRLYPEEVGFIKNRDAIAVTQPPAGFSGFINQRIRWASKSGKLIDRRVLSVLLITYFFNVLIFINLCIASWFSKNIFFIGVGMFSIKLVMDMVFFQNVLQFFKTRYLLKMLFLMQIIYVSYAVFLGISSLFGRYKWRGRRVTV